MLKNCKICEAEYYTWSNLQTKCPKCTPRIPTKGKRGKTYDYWLKTEARPYLDRLYGLKCISCNIMPPLKSNGVDYYRHDVDHIKKRGSHQHLKYDLNNVCYRCRICHQKRHNINW